MSFGKRLRNSYKSFDRTKKYTISEASKMLIKLGNAKFDETIDIAINLNIDTRHADQQVRSTVTLPAGTGKALRVAVFAKNEKSDEAKAAGADFVGEEDLMEEIKNGMLDFDRCIATPDMMAVVGRLGQILGPKNLMPNPKLGTVTQNVTEAVKAAKSGEVQFRADKSGVVHAGIGKVSMGEDKIMKNIISFVKAVKDNRPSGAKGIYIKNISVATTMGVGITIDVTSLDDI